MSNDSLPAGASDLAARVVELEQRLTFQQAAYDQLNGVVLEQQAELQRLHRETKSLRDLLQGLLDRGLGEDLPHEKPPHY
jgi:uncharacterized coiled-coil protein SlyX